MEDSQRFRVRRMRDEKWGEWTEAFIYEIPPEIAAFFEKRESYLHGLILETNKGKSEYQKVMP